MSSTARPTTWLVTGANRGIGLEIVRQLLQSPTNLVIATARNPDKAAALHDLAKTAKGTLHVLKLDISDFDAVRALPKQLEPILGDAGLDYLVSNAATANWDSAFTLDPDALLAVLRTNTVAPALLSQVVLPFLEKGRAKTIAHISSSGGSIGRLAGGNFLEEFKLATPYPMSKTALNMLAYKQKLERPDLIVLALCPGYVKTDMGGSNAVLEPSESVAGVLKVITSATHADSGKFLRYNGEEIPW